MYLIHSSVKVFSEQTFEEKTEPCDQMKRISLSVVKDWTEPTQDHRDIKAIQSSIMNQKPGYIFLNT